MSTASTFGINFGVFGMSPNQATAYFVGSHGFSVNSNTTVRNSAAVPPNTVNAQFGEQIISKALGQYVPIVIGTGRVNGIFVLGGTTIITKSEYTVIEDVVTDTETIQPPPYVQQQADPLFGQPLIITQAPPSTFTRTTITETVVETVTTETVVMVGYVLAFDALKSGYTLIRLEVNNEVLYDGEHGISSSRYRFYNGRQTANDPITDSMVGALSGAYQHYVMLFLEGYSASSPPSIVAVISNSAAGTATTGQIEWVGQTPRFSPMQEAPHGFLEGIHGANAVYDPNKRMIYDLWNPYCHGDFNLSDLWLAVCDVDALTERYRIVIEDTRYPPDASYNSWTLAMRGTQYMLVRWVLDGHCETIIVDTLTGKRFLTWYEPIGVGILWNNGSLFGNGQYYVIVGRNFSDIAAVPTVFATAADAMAAAPPEPSLRHGFGGGGPSPPAPLVYIVINLADATYEVGTIPCPIDTTQMHPITAGRNTGATISFFTAGPVPGRTGEIVVYELIWNGSGWIAREIYSELTTVLGTGFMYVLWYDPGTRQLITGMDHINIRIIDPSTGLVKATPFTGAAANFQIWQNFSVSWAYAGKERMWPRPGFVFLNRVAGSGVDLLDLRTLTIEEYAPDTIEVGSQYFACNVFDQAAGYYVEATYDQHWQVHYVARYIPNMIPLTTCITWIMSLAGFTPADLEFDGLAGIMTYGFTIASDTTYQAVLNQLQEVYTFTYCDTGNGFYFKKAGTGTGLVIDVTLDDSNMVETDPPVKSTDQSDFSTPIMTWFEYVSKESGYKSRPVSFVMAANVSESIRRIRFSAPIVMTDADAQKFVTEKHFYLQENRRSHEFIGQASMIVMLPGDIAAVPSQDITYITQIEQMAVDLRNMAVEIVTRDFQPSVETLITAVSNSGGVLVQPKFDTRYYHLDVPLLNYAHDLAGAGLMQYGYLSGMGQATWTGGYIMRGYLPSSLAGLWDMPPHLRVSGYALNILPDMPDAHSADFTNSLTIQVTNGSIAQLDNATELEIMAGNNIVFYGKPGRWEVMGCMDFVDIGNNQLTLLNFPYRGARGTEIWAARHEVNDTVLIVPNVVEVRRASHPVTDLDMALYYKPVGTGQDPKYGVMGSYVITGAAETPYAPVFLDAVIVATDIVLSWSHRSRLSEWEFFSTTPDSGEESLAFDIEIMAGGNTIKRTLTSTTNSVTYTSAQISSDWGGIPVAVSFRVYQKSAVVGRGYMAENTVFLTSHDYPLDGTAPTAAWSASRDLLTSFIGNPRYTASGGTASFFNDQTGNVRHLTNAIAFYQPAVVTAGPYNRTCLAFSDAGNMRTPSDPMSEFISLTSGYIICSVMIDTPFTGDPGIIWAEQSGYVRLYATAAPTNEYGIEGIQSVAHKPPDYADIATPPTIPAVPNVPYVVEWLLEDGIISVRVNRGVWSSVDFGDLFSLTTPLTLGEYVMSQTLNFKIFEMATWSTPPPARDWLVVDFMDWIGAT